MSAQDEFPPGWEYTTPSSEAIAWWNARPPKRRRCAEDAWWLWTRVSGITREEYTAMRAAVERCKELEAELARVTVERDTLSAPRYRDALCFSAQAIANAIDAERELCSEEGDAARDIPSDPHAAFIEGLLRAYAIARDWWCPLLRRGGE